MSFTRAITEREFQIRTANRYTLHALGKKQCTRCDIIYDNISENFDVHRICKKRQITEYTGSCKNCMKKYREQNTKRIKSTIETYAQRLLAAIRNRAKSECLVFSLESSDLVNQWKIQEGLCYYTGQFLNLSASKEKRNAPHIDFPSLDRKKPLH